MNERDSESAAAVLLAAGHTEAVGESDADLVLVNTCSVRGKAEDKAIGKLGLLVSGMKKKNPDAIVGAMGCMIQRLGDSIFDKVKGLDFGVGTRSLPVLEQIIEQVLHGSSGVTVLDEVDHGVVTAHRVGQISAFVNILMGCDRRCSYCIVPTVRGSEWSRAGVDVLNEVRALVEDGVKEVTFLGQSVMSYGRKNEVWDGASVSAKGFKEPLPRLLEAASGVEGLERIRFTSGHPSGCTDEMAKAVAELDAVCEHMHVPVQSGSDRVLESMGRGYTSDQYRESITRIREKTPELALTTDVIVGYPGETEGEFEMTRQLMEDMKFDNAFIFKYSPRPGTRAAELDDDVPDDEKARRNAVLLEDQDARGRRLNDAYIGKDVEVLCEGASLRNKERLAGRTRGNKIAVFDMVEGVKAGQRVTVTVNRAGPQTLYGEMNEDT
jgi:tRNA-2-methylthio-N6-dimethylallyladenosine synthase